MNKFCPRNPPPTHTHTHFLCRTIVIQGTRGRDLWKIKLSIAYTCVNNFGCCGGLLVSVATLRPAIVSLLYVLVARFVQRARTLCGRTVSHRITPPPIPPPARARGTINTVSTQLPTQPHPTNLKCDVFSTEFTYLSLDVPCLSCHFVRFHTTKLELAISSRNQDTDLMFGCLEIVSENKN